MTYEEALEIATQALEEAVYLLNPTDEDMQKKTGVYRVVTARNVLCKELEDAEEKREWVGLTQEELQDLCAKSYYTDRAGETHFIRGFFADAIEAKLKEKNT